MKKFSATRRLQFVASVAIVAVAAIYFWGTGTSTPQYSGTNSLTAEDLEAIRREVPSVSMVTPTVNSRSQLVAGNMNWNTQIQGVSEQYPEVRKWPVQSGEFFGETEVRTAGLVIVIGQTIAEQPFPRRSSGGTDPASCEPSVQSDRRDGAQGPGSTGP